MQTYKHTQIGYVVLVLVGTGAAVLLLRMLTGGATALMTGMCVVLLLALLLFGTATVEISGDKFSFRFGVGLIRKMIPLSEIERCVRTTYPWYYGWGIRYTPQGWLLNVSGTTAVSLTMKNGKKLQLGTDDADELCSVVTHAIAGLR
jgi:hypothetical protein